MPHMLIEYTKGVEETTTVSQLIASVYQGACNSELFDNKLIKTRALSFSNYLSGTSQDDFIHVTAKILAGRTTEQRKTLSSAILAELESILSDKSPISITVEVVDIDRESHSQFLN